MQFQLFDLLPDDEYAALRADIAKRGVLVPVELDENGIVLDGHHRIRACQELGIAHYPRTIRSGMSDDEKEEHIVTLNVRRRHLDTAAKRRWAEWFLLRHPEWSNREVGRQVGVDGKTVADVRQGIAEVPQSDRVQRRGGGTYPARRPSVTTQSDREQERAQQALSIVGDDAPDKALELKRLERIAREKEAQRRRDEAEDSTPPILPQGAIDIRHCAIDELELEPDSVDLIFTDPPYPGGYLDVWDDLGRFAAQALKPGSMLIAYSGQVHLPEALRRLSDHLPWWWCYGIRHTLQQSIHLRQVRCAWKPLLVFRKAGNTSTPWTTDFFSGSSPEKSLHPWQQAEAEAVNWVRDLTTHGQLVVDPFVGSGTTAAACKALGRRFVGCDIDPVAVATARQRVA